MKYVPYSVQHFGTMDSATAPWDIANAECQDALNIRQKNNGAWYGREGSLAHEYQNTTYPANNFPYEGRLLHEYRTEAGTPAVGSPGVTAAGDIYIIHFVNTDAASGYSGGLFVRKLTGTFDPETSIDAAIATGTALIQQYVDETGTVQKIASETDTIPEGATFHGKAILPMPTNGTLWVWIENGVWYVKKVARPDFDIQSVYVDTRTATGQQNDPAVGVDGPLALAHFHPKTNKAAIQTDGLVGVELASGYAGSGNGNSYVVNRADNATGEEYDDIERDPVRDNDREPVVATNIIQNYKPVASPTFPTADYLCGKDIFYRPTGQVTGWDKSSPHQLLYPRNAWRYRYVWDYGDGVYSNASADMPVGDLLWSVLGGTFTGEAANGLRGTTLTATCSGSATSATVTDASKFLTTLPGATTNYAPDGFWVYLTNGSDSAWAWCTNVNVGTNTLTFATRPDNSPSFLAGANVLAYFDTTSTVSPVSSGDATAKAALLKLKSQLYDSSHPHYADDVWISTQIIGKDHQGWFDERDIGQPDWLGCEDHSNKATLVTRNQKFACTFGIAPLADGTLPRFAGFTLDTRNAEASTTDSIPTGTRTAYPLRGTDDSTNPGYTAMGSIVPNALNITEQKADIDYFKESAGSVLPLLVLGGKLDWVFFRTASQSQTDGRSIRCYWNQISGTSATTFRANLKSQYEGRLLVDAKRLIWDWQLSQFWPSSIVFGCPRMGFTIKHLIGNDRVPAGAKKLLVFRTRVSSDPAYSATDFGLVKIVDVPAVGTDLQWFDDVKDTDLDFDDGPQNYEGLRFGINARYIDTMGERVFYANTTTFYWPFAPRDMVSNADADTVDNRVCRIMAVDAPSSEASPFAGTVPVPDYIIRFVDKQGIAGEEVAITPEDARTTFSTPYVIVGYFLSQGYNDSIAGLQVFRVDQTDIVNKLYFTLDLASGGFFYDHDVASTGIAYTASAKKTERDPSAVWYSEPLHPEFIPPTNLQDVKRQDGDFITGINIQFSNLIIFKNRSTYRMFIDTRLQDPQAERMEVVSHEEGCIAPCTLIEHAGVLFYLSQKGVRMLAGGNAAHPLDRHVYTDIQALIRPLSGMAVVADSVLNGLIAKDWTAVFVPRYSEYWLLANKPTEQTEGLLIAPITDDATVTVDISNEIPADYNLPFKIKITDGTHTDYGWVTAFTPDHTVTIVRGSPRHAFAAGNVTVYVEPIASGWMFDLSDMEHEQAKPSGLITSRIAFRNKKLFLTASSGYVYSTIFLNPAVGTARQTAWILEEDYHTYADDVQTPEKKDQEFVVGEWVSKRFNANMVERLKRMRFARVTFEHSGFPAISLPPFSYTMRRYNAALSTDPVSTLERYVASPSAGTALRNVKFVDLDADRGLDLDTVITASAYGFVLHGIEQDMRILQAEQ